MEKEKKIPSGYSGYHMSIYRALRLVKKQYDEVFRSGSGSVFADPHNDIHQYFDNVTTVQGLSVLAVVSSALTLEGVINWIISTQFGLDAEDSQPILRRENLNTKWLRLPPKYLDGYSVPNELEKRLRDLGKLRNAIVHHKPQVSYTDKSTHHGNIKEIFDYQGDMFELAFNLPLQLTENIRKYGNPEFKFITGSCFFDILSDKPNFSGVSMD